MPFELAVQTPLATDKFSWKPRRASMARPWIRSSERNSCWLTISSSSIAEAFGLERGTLPSEGADGTAQSGLSFRVFNDAPEHLEQSVIALFDSLTLRPPMVKCNWKKKPYAGTKPCGAVTMTRGA